MIALRIRYEAVKSFQYLLLTMIYLWVISLGVSLDGPFGVAVPRTVVAALYTSTIVVMVWSALWQGGNPPLLILVARIVFLVLWCLVIQLAQRALPGSEFIGERIAEMMRAIVTFGPHIGLVAVIYHAYLNIPRSR